MSETKLMRPLFYKDKFNRDGHKMRAVFCKQISDGNDTFRIWRRDGVPEIQCPRAENDDHLLYLELNGYLAPMRRTEFDLIQDCGFPAACQSLYGGEEQRASHFRHLRQMSPTSNEPIADAIRKEDAETQRLGAEPERQAAFVKDWLREKVETYQKAKGNGGETFPDFIGALALSELEQCVELFAKYRVIWQRLKKERAEKEMQEQERLGQIEIEKLQQRVAEAEQTIRTSGEIENAEIDIYESGKGYRTTCMFAYLLQKYQIAVPLRTMGWVINNLTHVVVRRDGTTSIRYMRAAKSRSRGSERIFSVLSDLIRAVRADSVGGAPGGQAHGADQDIALEM